MDKINRIEAVISRRFYSLEERLNAKFEQLVQSEVGRLRDEINNDISHLREQLKGVEAKQEIQKNNHEQNFVIKNLPENPGEDLGSAVNGLFKDGLQLQEVSILKTERIPSRIANKPGIVMASVQTKEMYYKVLRAKKHLKDSRNQVYKKVYIDTDKPHAIRTMEANFRSLIKGINNDSITMTMYSAFEHFMNGKGAI